MGERFRLLVTGFGPFPGVPSNPTAAVARQIDGRSWGPVRVHAAVLPTTWSQARPELDAAVAAARPDGLIMLGVAAREGIQVERVARNRVTQRLDAIGALPGAETVEPEGPDACQTTLPWAALMALGVGASDDAGTYLCNAVFYHALRRYPEVPQRGFVHVPHGPVAPVIRFLERAAAILATAAP